MSELVRNYINVFDTLPENDKIELVYELLKRTSSFENFSLTDELFTLRAEELFLELDKEEVIND